MDLNALLRALGYLQSKRHWVTSEPQDPRVAQHYRLAQRAVEMAGASFVGTYVYQTSPGDILLPSRPAIVVVYADNDDQARDIHKRLWNLGDCPFLIIVQQGVIRVYAGFDYSSHDDKRKPIASGPDVRGHALPESLAPFSAEAVDSGRIWQEQSKYLGSDTRVDSSLLKNLRKLSHVLQSNHGLTRKVAHALIGKYIYFRYLRDRGILDDEWLGDHDIALDDVFSRTATPTGFCKLADALQARFNGAIFPLPSDDDRVWLNNDSIPFLAGVLHGDTTEGQLALDFGSYDFSYIPVELLSSVYEQFLKDEGGGEGDGVVYTPEPLADYILAEINAVCPLKDTHKVLDPCCGSGVFLVLAYRRLIELTWREKRERPSAEDLKQLLLQNIFGVERDAEACHITAFSLILTLCTYLEPRELKANSSFQFPTLVNENIYEADFFDSGCPVFAASMQFDWIVGNPPWNGADKHNQKHKKALEWLHNAARNGKPVGELRLDEAFSWRLGELLREAGFAALLVKATTLVNSTSKEYRKAFFRHYDVRRITNLSNLRRILFMGPDGKRAEAPAACLVYGNSPHGSSRLPILHFGPFVANQIPVRSKGGSRRVWTITLYEGDIQQIDYPDATNDTPYLWKTALWGNYQDRRALARISAILPKSLVEIIADREWMFGNGPHIRANKSKSKGTFVFVPQLVDKSILETVRLQPSSLVPDDALTSLPPSRQFVRKRGGTATIGLMFAPHIFVSATHAVYGDQDFIISAPNVGIAASHGDRAYLKAIALYLNSSVARYAHFFHSAFWGVYIGTVNPENVGAIPFVDLSPQQIETLSLAYDEQSQQERERIAAHAPLVAAYQDTRDEIDDIVEKSLGIPRDIGEIARDFMRVRYQLLEGKTGDSASKPPTTEDLNRYAEQFRLYIDDFAQRHHRVTVLAGRGAIIATAEVTGEDRPVPVAIARDADDLAQPILRAVEESHGQWAYIQRSVRIFDGPRVHIVKAARLLDWTGTQAIQDAADLISDVMNRTNIEDERVAA